MNTAALKLRNPPIVEAVLDIDCDAPPGFDLDAVEERARERFRERYPIFRKQILHALEIAMKTDAQATTSARQAAQALQFCHDDDRQLVQVRAQGFSFNRLAPYSSLDDYLPEIEWAWRAYVEVTAPVETQVIRLRYINRILLPMDTGKVELDDYFKVGPRLVDETALELTGFFIQHASVEKATGHHVQLVLTAQDAEREKLPVILDIGVAHPLRIDPCGWRDVRQTINSLRGLKNRIFLNTLTDQCLQLFQ